MSDSKERARALYKPPFRYEFGYIYDAEKNVVADDPCGSPPDPALRVRSWGRISYLPEPEKLQDAVGELIAEALTESWQARAPQNEWRRLALQFDGHRMQALGWLKVAAKELPETPEWSALREFLSAGPLSGEEVLAQRIAEMAQQQAASVPDGYCAIRRSTLEGLVAIWERETHPRTGSPNHAHEVPGIWDSDNGKLAGKPCAECAMYDEARAALTTTPTAPADVMADAGQLHWLATLPCNSLHLERNGDHACNYMTASDWIDSNPEWFADDDPAEIQRMRESNTIWKLQIYPNTPVGFNVWHASTLGAVINAARAAEKGK